MSEGVIKDNVEGHMAYDCKITWVYNEDAVRYIIEHLEG